MKVLVTGVKGALGSGVAMALAERGHRVIGADFLSAELPGIECVAADMLDYESCIALGKDMDVITHLGAYHGVNLSRNERSDNNKTEKEFFDANVVGTFNMLRSAVENQVPKVVWASSLVVYERGHWTKFGIYGLTKVVGEEMCQFFNREHHIKVIGLRFGTFVPADFLTRGFGMLASWVEPDEAVRSVIVAIENETIDFGMYDIHTPLPFTPEERWAYQFGKRVEVLQKHWPQHTKLIGKYADKLPPFITSVDMHHTQEELGFYVEHDFGWFLDELSKRDRAEMP